MVSFKNTKMAHFADFFFHVLATLENSTSYQTATMQLTNKPIGTEIERHLGRLELGRSVQLGRCCCCAVG
jgi:hypothetical protein